MLFILLWATQGMFLWPWQRARARNCNRASILRPCMHYTITIPVARRRPRIEWEAPYSFRDQGLRCEQGCRSDTINAIHLSKQTNLLTVVEAHGEGNGNPLQCSCLENPRDEGAWWAAVYGVSQSRTRLKRLSSSTSSSSKSSTSNRHSSSCDWILILTYSTKIYKPNSY